MSNSMPNNGTLYGIGVGPGDPELLTLKAARIIESAPVVSYLVNQHGDSQAREIAQAHLQQQREIPLFIPMQLDRQTTQQHYQMAAEQLTSILRAKQDIAVLCEGDPFFYGSFSYLHQLMAPSFHCEIIPGINSIQAAAAISQAPLCLQSDSFSVVTSRNTDEQILEALHKHPCVAILKVGKSRPRLLTLLQQSGRWQQSIYIENATRSNQTIYHQLDQVPPTPGPYFSLFLTTQ